MIKGNTSIWPVHIRRCLGRCRPSSVPVYPILILAITVTLLMGCATSEREGDPLENQRPHVWLSSAPPEGSTRDYKIHMFWGGWDPDGRIAYYEYAITDNGDGPFDPADTTGIDKWSQVFGNDSVFVFSADQLADSNSTSTVSEFTRSHTFFVRAVDEQGLSSFEPAYRSFTALTLSPRVVVDVPRYNGLNPAMVPPVIRFSWTATDFFEGATLTVEPESTQLAFVSTHQFNEDWGATINYLRRVPEVLDRFGKTREESDAEWLPWTWYGAPDDSGKFWTTPELPHGPYVFAIRAKDEAGAVTAVLAERENVRRVVISPHATGPVFTVANEFLGLVRTSVCSTPVVVLDIPAGVPLTFQWRADASAYGGRVSGYRYGWDIADLSDPTQWEIDYTPFTSSIAASPERTFFFGTHTFTVEVIDNNSICSRVEYKVNIVQFTMSRNLLVLDDFAADEYSAGWHQSNGVLPSDEEHTEFWRDMVRNVDAFSPEGDMIRVSAGTPISLEELGSYKSIIWSVYADAGTYDPQTLFYRYVNYQLKNLDRRDNIDPMDGKRSPNVIALFMAAGGHVLITGRQPITNVINREYALGFNWRLVKPPPRYPFMFRYDLEGQLLLPNLDGQPIGDQSFAYQELCLETLDFAIPDPAQVRGDTYLCNVWWQRSPHSPTRLIDDGMREAIPYDPAFPRLELRQQATLGTGYAYSPNRRSYEAEIYNPQYFFDECDWAIGSRDCFQPIYGMHCLRQSSPNYGQPVAFFTSAFADRIAEAPNSVGARSAVFGFPPVYFKPSQVKPGIEHILFCEWQLPATTPINCSP